MEISTERALKMSAAANMLTEMVLPNRRGVEISTSCERLSHPLRSRIDWCARANAPGASVLKKIRAHALIKLSWNMRWWKLLCHPMRSIVSSATLHSWIRANPSLAPPTVFRWKKACSAFWARPFCSAARARSVCTLSNASYSHAYEYMRKGRAPPARVRYILRTTRSPPHAAYAPARTSAQQLV